MSTASPPWPRLQHDHYRVPITALAFLTPAVILAGQGTYLHAYDTVHAAKLASLRVFPHHTVHGIVIDSTTGRSLLYGGPCLCAARISHQSEDEGGLRFELSHVQQAADRILTAAFSPHSPRAPSLTAGFVTAHNALAICRLSLSRPSADGPAQPGLVLHPPLTPSNSILYSAHLSWPSASHCLVASGTAFGDVIVWSAFLTHDVDGRLLSACSQLHYTFLAHEGSVFGLRLSHPVKLSALPGERRLLASCSDDRTVAVWDVTHPDLRESPTRVQVRTETGFGVQASSDAYAPPCLAKAMGHVSRIWQVRFLPPSPTGEEQDREAEQCSAQGDSGKLEIISFGEDATAIIWHLERCLNAPSASTLPFRLEQSTLQSRHSGKNIWSTALSPSGRLLATGGADGAIAISHLGRSNSVVEIERSCLRAAAADATGAAGRDKFRAYTLVAPGTLIATTDHGCVACLALGPEGRWILQSLSDPLRGLRAFSVVASLDGVAYAAGTEGSIHAFAAPCAARQDAYLGSIPGDGSKTAGLFAWSAPHLGPMEGGNQRPVLLITSVGAKSARLLSLPHWQGGRSAGIRVQEELAVALPPAFVVTSATDVRDYLTLGARDGRIALLSLLASPIGKQGKTTSGHILLSSSANDAITSLYWHPTHPDRRTPATKATTDHLFSTARDGTYAIHRLGFPDSEPGGAVQSQLVHRVSLPFGPNIEGLAFTEAQLLVHGFRGKHFVVYDCLSQRQVLSVECGGAKRQWSFRPPLSSSLRAVGRSAEGGFVWTKASRVYSCAQTGPSEQVINAGAHGREIKALAVSPLPTAGGPQIIATGAEDTEIKLFTYISRQGFRCLQTLRRHNTGIQHLQWSADARYLFSSGGFEEFFVWRIAHDVPGVGVGVVCEAALPAAGKSELRIVGFDVLLSVGEGDGGGVRREGVAVEVLMALSDSSVKLWRCTAGNWSLLATGHYLTSCLTHALRLRNGEEDCSITAATDGHVASWTTLPYTLEPASAALTDEASAERAPLLWRRRHRIHQNAVLALLHHPLPDGSALLVTGGDDNALAFTRWHAEHTRHPATLLIPRAHAAAVTALAVLPAPAQGGGKVVAVSAGSDQRVKLWGVSVDAGKEGVEGVRVELLRSGFTAVADVSEMSVLRLEGGGLGVLVVGIGMEVWRVEGVGLGEVAC